MTDNRKSWTIEQDQAIQSIVEQIGTKNWPLVSQLMKEKYLLYHRSGKQCRERWHNHLNPELNKQPWTQSEQHMLFQAHRKNGNRWIQISKLFGGRTDNSIKNHFYSTIRRSMRRVCKILGNRNSTSKLRNIRPSILSEIFQFSKTQPMKSAKTNEIIDISSCLLQYARQKPRKSSQFDPSSKDDLQMVVNRLIFLNDEYVNFKNQKKDLQSQAKTSKKESKAKLAEKLKLRAEEMSETNSSISEGQYFERQHKSQVSEQNILSNIIETQNQNSNLLASNSHQEFQSISLGQQLEIESLQDNYLIIKQFPIHSMFDSQDNFNHHEHQFFHHLEKPSFQQICCSDDLEDLHHERFQ